MPGFVTLISKKYPRKRVWAADQLRSPPTMNAQKPLLHHAFCTIRTATKLVANFLKWRP